MEMVEMMYAKQFYAMMKMGIWVSLQCSQSNKDSVLRVELVLAATT